MNYSAPRQDIIVATGTEDDLVVDYAEKHLSAAGARDQQCIALQTMTSENRDTPPISLLGVDIEAVWATARLDLL